MIGDSPIGRRWLGLLVACLVISLALYAALAVILGNVPAGWNSPVGFALPTAEMFRAFNGLPVVALSPAGFTSGIVATLTGLWVCWAVSLLALRRIAAAGSRRRATTFVLAGTAAMLALVVVFVPPILSSDLFRQAAYGRMAAYHHLNPYATPVNAIPDDPSFALANHRHLTTHYGPAYTLLSALAVALAPSSALGLALAWKTMSACAALACALLAPRVARALGSDERDGQEALLWLGWNPLLVIESAVSGHLEPIMMAAALGGILIWRRGPMARGAAVLAVSTLVKWVSGLLLLFAAAREVWQADRERRLRAALALSGAAALTAALLYAPFARGMLTRRGGISDIAMRGAETLGGTSAIPQWVLMAGFAILVLALLPFAARGDWARLVATTGALSLVFTVVVTPWFYPWYYLAPLVLAAPLPRGRARFILRGLSAGIGAISLLMYAKLIPWP